MARFSDVRWFDEIDSTNRWLADQARNGAPDGLVAIARHQSAGRGRLDRRWHAPPNSGLLCSSLVRLRAPIERWSMATMALGNAALDALTEAVPGWGARATIPVALKWPNDLVVPDLGDRKLAGILAELVSPSPTQPGAVILGIGMNLRRPDAEHLNDEAATRGAWLDELCAEPPDRPTLADALLRALEVRIDELESQTSALLTSYRSRCITLGSAVRVEFPDRVVRGTAVDVDETGTLLVTPHDAPLAEPLRVVAGEVTRVRPDDGP